MVQIGPHRRIVTLQVLACTPYFVRGGTPEGCSSDMRVFSFRLTAGGSAKNGTFCSVRIGEAILGMRTPVNFIVHTLQEVNDGLAHGRYFFMDVARDGIALYDADGTDLHKPQPKTPQQAHAMAQEYYDEWFPAGMRKFKLSKDAIEQHFAKEAAFLLHQTCESLYHCVLLVCTFYTPHVHNLGFLRTQAERIDRRLAYVWPSDTRRDRAMFEKLKEAYVKARYSKHYRVTEEQLEWLASQIEELGRVVHSVCAERLKALEADVRLAG